ncbi:hypothetical protein Sfulv_61110 [Streptomyces fulvorobeus]|uniref:Uncharacterized protein n=1 Tax=Streptomyces fulvorobeus TaxID=284028 RepID=A0A7J0CFM0_9ACTN|nr:hypothetical protein Sfulv_61110 [Streptomyces fulvorobeus]
MIRRWIIWRNRTHRARLEPGSRLVGSSQSPGRVDSRVYAGQNLAGLTLSYCIGRRKHSPALLSPSFARHRAAPCYLAELGGIDTAQIVKVDTTGLLSLS